MNISLNGYGIGYVTLEAAEGLTEGVLAKISANHTAAAAGDGEAFIGPGAVGPGRPGPLPALGHLHRGLHRRRSHPGL